MSDKKNMHDADEIVRARNVVEAYGADPARWPEADRALMERMESASALAAARDEAAGLDALLAEANADPALNAPEGMAARLLAAAPVATAPQATAPIAAAPRQGADLVRRFFSSVFGGKPSLAAGLPGGAYVAAALLIAGVAGFFTAAGTGADPAAETAPEAVFLAYAEDVFSDEEGDEGDLL